jgi:hypothetical protein
LENNKKLSSRADHPEFKEVTEKMLTEKCSMCTKYLFLLSKVEPGLTKNRGWQN